LPTDAEFTFMYGEGSFTLHAEQASTRGLALRVVTDESLGWDVDEPEDLRDLDT
jgi:2-phospho-L-lactate guanylyltransferase (CobY/MobA/RfbA family)